MMVRNLIKQLTTMDFMLFCSWGAGAFSCLMLIQLMAANWFDFLIHFLSASIFAYLTMVQRNAIRVCAVHLLEEERSNK